MWSRTSWSLWVISRDAVWSQVELPKWHQYSVNLGFIAVWSDQISSVKAFLEDRPQEMRFFGLMKPRLILAPVSVMSRGNQAPVNICYRPSQHWSIVVAAQCCRGVSFLCQWTGRVVRVKGQLSKHRVILKESSQQLRLGWMFTLKQYHGHKHTGKSVQEWFKDNCKLPWVAKLEPWLELTDVTVQQSPPNLSEH